VTTYGVRAERTFRTEFTFDADDIEPGDSPEDAAEELLPEANSVHWELVDWDTQIRQVDA
jgi:hypothetical protein